MTPERWRQITEIFHSARALRADERAAFLGARCGNDLALRREVESMLAADQEAEASSDRPPISTGAYGTTLPLSGDSLTRGSRVGPYKILERVGEGGMGVVYLAEQEHPLRRRVALKVIKIGMDTREVSARFEAERQALALMDHPCVAKVYDAGASSQGRPYFAMEYVPGIPITEYCDKHRLPMQARLELFVQVCSGIQHAHQKGIIHRDIKPSNVLVAMKDGKPEAKVIDFGVAKAVNQHLTEKTVFTQHGVLIGTPAYMSPEQADMDEMNVDRTTDVYSLGALLYELLVGVTAFDAERLRAAGYAEIQRIIRQEEPVRPSARLSGLHGARDTIAHQRRTDLSTLARALKGDLDWITLKAMEKDRTRRYAAASELAADVLRHLKTEPVVARPASVIYRAGKFARKHRVAVIAGALGVTASTIVSAAFQAQTVVAATADRIISQAEFIALNVSNALADSALDESLAGVATNLGVRRELETALAAESVVQVLICDAQDQIVTASDPRLRGACPTVSPVQELSSVSVLTVLGDAIARQSAGYAWLQSIGAGDRKTGSVRVLLSPLLLGEQFRRALVPVVMSGIAQIVGVIVVTAVVSWFVLRRD
jgi:eukaryotic-like serine/threonine-protein kinase